MSRSKKYIQDVKDYNSAPNFCLNCGEAILCDDNYILSSVKKKKFCNSSCAASYNNRNVVRNSAGNASNLHHGFAGISIIDSYSDEQLLHIYNNSHSILEFSQLLGYKQGITLKSKHMKEKFESLGIDLNNLKSKHINKRVDSSTSRQCLNCGEIICRDNKSGLCQKCYRKKMNEEKLAHWLATGDTGCQTGASLRNCIRDYIYNKQNGLCAICGMSNTWNGKDLKFVLDHIDGDASNNKECNLRLICPNCDSQLDTYKSKNKNSARNYRHKYYMYNQEYKIKYETDEYTDERSVHNVN